MSVTVEQFQINSTTGSENTEYAPTGYKVLGVGWKVLSPSRSDIIVNQYPTSDATGWNFVVDNLENTSVSFQMNVWLVCSNAA
jgi:hypothetical protein